MTDHIQIGDVSPRVRFIANGVDTDFPFSFPIFKDADLKVYVDGVERETGFTVTGAGQSAGGSVTFDTAPADQAVVVLLRRLAIVRTTDFQESGEFRAKAINDELDYQTAALQQIADDVGRAVGLDPIDPSVSITLPVKDDRAGKYLAFDAEGQAMAAAGDGSVPVSSVMEPIVQAASVADGRNAMGLGDAATKNVGTEEGDVVAVQAGGALPALDGSALTGIDSVTDAERANILLNAFRIQIVGGLSVLDMIDGVVDEFEDESGISGLVDGTYIAPGDYITNAGGLELLDATGTYAASENIQTGTMADTYDNNTSTTIKWGAAVATAIKAVTVQLASAVAATKLTFTPGPTSVASWTDVKFYGSNDGSSWTQIGATLTKSFTDAVEETIEDVSQTTAYLHYKLEVTVNSGAGIQIELREWEIFTAAGSSDMTAISDTVTALAQPDEAHLVLWEEDVDSVTPNTDLLAYVTRDGGTTWTQATLTEEANLSTGRILTGTADISAQPAGTSMAWKLITANTKELKIHGVGLEWR